MNNKELLKSTRSCERVPAEPMRITVVYELKSTRSCERVPLAVNDFLCDLLLKSTRSCERVHARLALEGLGELA